VPDEKLRAEWFWTDRWFASSACCLPIDARGLYRELLTRAWSLGARLPTNPEMLMRLAGVTPEEWARCWPLVEPYFHEKDGHLVNATQLEVYADCQRRQAMRTARAKKAAQARWEQCSSNAQAKLTVCPPSPDPSLSLSKDPDPKEALAASRRTRGNYTAGFEGFWQAYPAGNGGTKGSKKKAFDYWKRDKLEDRAEELLEAIAAYCRSPQWDKGFVPYPQKWLNQRLYEVKPTPRPGTTKCRSCKRGLTETDSIEKGLCRRCQASDVAARG
jgi:uncharacterized protein YdaU (DUF1376 family)